MEFSEIKDWFYRQIKEAPNAKTGYVIPFFLKELIPATKQHILANRKIYSEVSLSEAYRKSLMFMYKYWLKYPKYVYRRSKDRLLNKSWFNVIKEEKS